MTKSIEANRRQQKSRVARKTVDMPQHLHGRRSGYCNWGCRCAPCTVANADYQSARKRRVRAAQLSTSSV